MIDLVAFYVIPTALAILPSSMDSIEARAHMLAIGLQEGDQLKARRQYNGPAKGFWQFEQTGGVRGVLTHPKTRSHALTVLELLRYDATLPPEALERTVYLAIEHNDLLAAVFARLNLWWLPGPLARRDEPGKAWEQYLAAWRPGKPHEPTWAANHQKAWQILTERTGVNG